MDELAENEAIMLSCNAETDDHDNLEIQVHI